MWRVVTDGEEHGVGSKGTELQEAWRGESVLVKLHRARKDCVGWEKCWMWGKVPSLSWVTHKWDRRSQSQAFSFKKELWLHVGLQMGMCSSISKLLWNSVEVAAFSRCDCLACGRLPFSYPSPTLTKPSPQQLGLGFHWFHLYKDPLTS